MVHTALFVNLMMKLLTTCIHAECDPPPLHPANCLVNPKINLLTQLNEQRLKRNKIQIIEGATYFGLMQPGANIKIY